MYAYRPMLRRLEHQVRTSFRRQILDIGRPDDGAFVSRHPDVEHWMTVSHDLSAALFAFLADESALAGDDELFERILRAISYQRRCQHRSGLIDLESTNWESPPDTAFTLLHLIPPLRMARSAAENGDRRAMVISRELGEYVRTAAHGIVGRGFHTANHRWVVTAALGMARRLFSDLQAEEYIDTLLAEGIDMSPDGEYTERSTGIYNAVCNRSLRYMADSLERPDLLDYVRRNLDMMTHFSHADGTTVTTFSVRDDKGRRVVPHYAADSFFDMAQRDGNPEWAAVADMLVKDAPDLTWAMEPFMTHAEYRTHRVEPGRIRDDFSLVYPAGRIWRVRRGELSATAAAGMDFPFELKFGSAHLRAVRVAGTSFGIAVFRGETFEETERGVRMTHRAEGRGRPGYDLPLGRPVPWGTFEEAAREREVWQQDPFVTTLTVEEVDGGFDLHVRTEGGMPRVPWQFECCFDGPGRWETRDAVTDAENGQTGLLKNGFGVFRVGDEALAVGPGAAVHRSWRMRGSDPLDDAFRVLVTMRSPVERTLRVRGFRYPPAGLRESFFSRGQ